MNQETRARERERAKIKNKKKESVKWEQILPRRNSLKTQTKTSYQQIKADVWRIGPSGTININKSKNGNKRKNSIELSRQQKNREQREQQATIHRECVGIKQTDTV